MYMETMSLVLSRRKRLSQAKSLQSARERLGVSRIGIHNICLGRLVNQEANQIRPHIVPTLFIQLCVSISYNT